MDNILVTLIGKNKINKLVLPETPIGNYWVVDKNEDKAKKLVNIEGIDGNWQVIGNNYVDVIDINSIEIKKNQIKVDRSKIIMNNRITLKEYAMCGIILKGINELFILYCSPIYEKNFTHLDIKNSTEFFIGNGHHNHISYNNKMVANIHARIFFYDGRWMIENMDSNFGTFVNYKPVLKERTILFNGDIVYIMGLRIIIMGKSIFINNPLNTVLCSNDIFKINRSKLEIPVFEQEEDRNIDLYSENDYFSRVPRITNIIEKEKVKIDAPPQIQDKEEMPAILMIGSSLSMGVIMMISIVTAIDGRMSGTASTKQTVFSVITALVMLISMILFPVLTIRYNKKRKKKYEEKRQKRYKKYLDNKREAINKIMNKQKNILYKNYVSPEECAEIISEKNARLWERKIEDYDFLSVRLGIGDVPLEIDIQYPEERFTMEDDNLVEILNDIVSTSKNIKSAPIVLSLVQNNISALIIQKNEKIERFIQSLIIQLIAFQSYEDLKLVFLLKEDKIENLEYVKMLPHIWDNTKQIRFFAYDYNEMNEISKYLEEEFQFRLQYKDKDYKSFMPYYLIITNDYKKIENLRIINEILKTKINLGFSILCISDDLMQLPNECKTFISLNRDNKTGMIFENEISSKNQKHITFDTSTTFFFEKICQAISNIPIKYSETGSNLLPNTYTFLEMYDVGCIEQLNILERWNKNDPTLSLKAPIGIDGAGNTIFLDIHEKFHGPHGLIAGSTGSGKSEFIITYILSLAINYHPDDVNFILIDYKGGGLAGAFEKRGAKLPHLVGTITNIDTNGLQRSLVSIQSELRRRQIIFNEARNKTDEGTIDIYKYQKLYHQGIVDKPVPHLLIICDEFAELKQQQAEFMDELISVSRIGRSLGVHLILATQKPAGIVNDQIRSNSKFAICLKVQDTGDSNDVIKRPDAANLKRVGQFYMQVGNDEYFVLGQSAWSGASYFPSNIIEKKVDNSIEFISNIGTTIKQVDDTVQKVVSSKGEQLTNIVRYLYKLAEEEEIQENNLWLESIPETIFLKDLKKKYRVTKGKNEIIPIIGEYDDPFNQRQGIVQINLSNGGNTIIFGNAESGKETLLSTMIYDLITTYDSEEVQLYLLDFGTEALKIYKESPHVGDVVFINDVEKINRFFEMIQKEIKHRKSILLEYNGDYDLYSKTSNKPLPMIIIVINNYEAFAELYEDKYEDIFLTLSREATKCGIVFVVTTNSFTSMRYRLSQNFKQKIALQMNNDGDYYNVFEKVGKKRPSHLFGRGLVTIDNDEIYEFQTAKICKPEEYNTYIKEEIEKSKKVNNSTARPIPVIPEKVTFKDVEEYLKGLSKIPIGITQKDIKIYSYDFKKDFINLITSRNMDDAIQFTTNILEEIREIKNINIAIFDAERTISNKIHELKEEYIEFISNIEKNDKQTICIIIGVDKFITYFENGENSFEETLRSMNKSDLYNIILVENVNKLKNHEYDNWYRNYISKDNGIWIGNGIENQYLITVDSNRKEMVNDCGSSFGYIIRQGTMTFVKLLEMKENGDMDE